MISPRASPLTRNPPLVINYRMYMAHCLFAGIADDFTGGSDLAGMLSQQGVRTLQLFGTQHASGVLDRARAFDAVIIGLKTRSISAPDAVRESLEALALARSLHARQVQFKYCSTFDSTEQGNIGPVTDALMRAMDVPFTIAVPALPVNGRTQYLGHLFVNGELLSDSPMRNHPLNPMTDSNLVRFLQKQTTRRVGLIPLHADFEANAEIALVDAITEDDLLRIADNCVDMPLITGGSGIAMKLPQVWRERDLLSPQTQRPSIDRQPSGTLIVAGSCSAATLRQLEILEAGGCPTLRLDTEHLDTAVDQALAFAQPHLDAHRPVCIRSSADKDHRAPAPGEAIEHAFAAIAKHVQTTRIIVAGGETSGAVVQALNITAAEVTHVIDPGVPALRSLDGIDLALKSGNFGAPDFFLKTMRLWEGQ